MERYAGMTAELGDLVRHTDAAGRVRLGRVVATIADPGGRNKSLTVAFPDGDESMPPDGLVVVRPNYVSEAYAALNRDDPPEWAYRIAGSPEPRQD